MKVSGRPWRAWRDAGMMPPSERDERDAARAGDRDMRREPEAVAVFKCDPCGDTFPTHEREDPRCPSCGATSVDPAHEPLL